MDIISKITQERAKDLTEVAKFSNKYLNWHLFL